MKKMTLMIVGILMATMNVNAQNSELKNEIGLFYGFGSASNVVSIITGAFSGAVGDQSNFWGPVGVEYYHHVTPVVAVGGIVSIAGCKVKDKNNSASDFTESFYTFMPGVKFNWFRKEHFGMYSGVAAGIMIASGDTKGNPNVKGESEVYFMGQGTALGVEFGGAFRGFAELGFGEKGVLCAGIRYKF